MEPLRSGVFITFAGNCREALTFYQSCFGGTLHFEMFDKRIDETLETPVVSASLISERIIICGSDLVHDEGRKIGNYVAVFLPCRNVADRSVLAQKLAVPYRVPITGDKQQPKLIEVTDGFDVRWILGL